MAHVQMKTAQEEVTRLLGRVAHEMRSPLTVIHAAAELALKPDNAERRERNLKLLLEASRSLQGLLQDVLDYSRLQEGGLELAMQPFALRDCLRHTVDGFALLAGRKGLELDWWIDPTTADQVKGDPGRLRQVLSNLLANAIKFTPRGGKVGLKVFPGGGYQRVTFEVGDTGIGIPVDAQKAIFEPYRQANPDIGRRYGGNGLGLAIVASLVELHGGHVTVESQPGQGSCFRFTMRLDRVASTDSLEPALLMDQQILVAAEDGSVLEELVPLLEGLGMRPVACSCGQKAVHLIEQAAEAGKPFPLSIFDLSLGGGEGLFLLGQVSPQLRQSTRVIATTRHGTRGDGAACLELGVSAYLTLPLEPGQLGEALETTLTASPGQLVTRHSLRSAGRDAWNGASG